MDKTNFDYSTRKPAGYWTFERCKEDALKYNSRRKWQVESNGAYRAAKRNGWYDECVEPIKRLNKPAGYWNKERCKKSGLNFKTKIDWKTNGNPSYNAAQRNGWLEECCGHMTPLQIYWTLDMCKEDALKYSGRTEWRDNSSAYSSASTHGWLEECCGHMTILKRRWTKEECKEDALKYKTKKEWTENSGGAYKFAFKNGHLKECCGHMIKLRNDSGVRIKWTFESCLEDARKYNTIKDWLKNSSGYDTAFKNGWLKECTAHMKTLSNNKTRLVYCVFFYGEKGVRSIYIGLTWDFNQRIGSHTTRNNSPVFKHIMKYGLKPKFFKLTDYISEKDAQKKEGEYQELAKNKNYNLLFSMKAGGLGGTTLIWTHNKVKKEALKYDDRSIWRKESPKSYDAACRNGWHKEMTLHMLPSKCKPQNYWTFERCLEDALKYKTRTEWSENSGGYQAANKYGWLEESCAHMIEISKPNGYWTLERCKEEALKYETKTLWANDDTGTYQAALKHGWLEECCAHMEIIRRLQTYWTLELCKEDALNYETKVEWKKNSNGAYTKTQKNSWFDECCSHMIIPVRWTLEKCKEDALKYKTKKEWRENSTSYEAAVRHGWISECDQHMTSKIKPNGYWTLEMCKEEALKYKKKSHWKINSYSSYSAAQRNCWLNECNSHMK